MADDEQPKRGRGRPRINPEGAVRRNVTVQVNSDLYEMLRGASEGSGLSISREIEARLQSSFDSVAAAKALEDAEAAGRAKEDAAYIEFFGGRHMMMVASDEVDLFQAALAETYSEWNTRDADAITDAFVTSLHSKVVAGQEKIINEWYDRIKIGRVLVTTNYDQLFDTFKILLDSPQGEVVKKALIEKIEGSRRRRRQKIGGGSDEE